MQNTAEIMGKGLDCLVENLGIVDAELFIMTIKRENFDYTEWRKDYFERMKPGQVFEEAFAYAETHPYKGKGKVL